MKKFSWRERSQSVLFAWRGILRLIRMEHNARIHLAIAVVVVLVALLIDLTTWEWVSLIISMAFVFTAELINTALEVLCDVVEPNHNKAIGEIKDFAAGAVLISAISSIIVGIFVFGPRLWATIT